MLRTSKTTPSATSTWVTSACQHSLGNSATKRFHELLGRLWGSGVTKPRATSTRQMVETEGTSRPGLAMWKWMVSAPASKPASANSLRSRTISSS